MNNTCMTRREFLMHSGSTLSILVRKGLPAQANGSMQGAGQTGRRAGQ